MSFYRSMIAAVAAMGLASAVFAADENTNNSNAAAKPAEMTQAMADQSTDQNAATATTDSKLNVNTATTKELMKVKGLNAAKAKAIVSYRKKHGEFKSLDDLKMVKGFKKMTDDQIKEVQDQLTAG